MTAPATPPTTTTPDPAAPDRLRVARGARHVRVGLVLGAAGTLALVGFASAGIGHGPALGVGNFVAASIMHVAIAAAILSASRIARALLLVWGLLCVVAASGLAAALVLAPGRPWPLVVPAWAMLAAPSVAGIGSLLATATPSADAWYGARRAARKARRRGKTLADWRGDAERVLR